MSRICFVALWVSAIACNGRDAGQRALDQLAELQKKKAADAAAKKEDKLAPLPPLESLKLEAPYNDDGTRRITPDGPCPDGLWALFAREAPGATPDEKKANEANRKALVEALTRTSFMVKLRVGSGVSLKPYDAAKGASAVEVLGSIDCTDAQGRIAIAWADAKAETHGEAGELSQYLWSAPPVVFTVPMKSSLEAKAFETENRIALSARVVFTAGKVEIDKRVKKIEKVTLKGQDETVEYGGGLEDWGAGRLLHAELVGIRVATEREKKQLFDLRGAPAK
jgi:hypothetical protein